MLSEVKSKYSFLLKEVQAGKQPVVFVNACTHGHEKVGHRVLETLKSVKIEHGTLVTNIANERAFEKHVPFVESDLNRVFPGKEDGDYEEQIAHAMHPVVQAVDVCIDIHSTQTMSVGSGSAIIVTKLDKKTKGILDVIKPPRVFLMNVSNGNAVISDARVGIGFEYGKDEESITHDYIVRDILKILSHLGMTSDKLHLPQWEQDTKFYDVFDVLPKADLELTTTLENFVPIKEGDKLGVMNGDAYLSPCDFVPILFGPNRYKDIYGFLSKEI